MFVVFSLDVYEKTKDGEKFVGSVINDNVATTQMPDIIPDVNNEMNELITNTISSVDPTSKLSPVLDNEKNVLYYKDSMGRRVDKDKFRKVLEGESIGALGGYESRELKSLFNNVLKQKGDNEFDYDGTLTEDQKKVINEPVKLEQNYRNFDYESPWEGTKYIKEEIDSNDKKN